MKIRNRSLKVNWPANLFQIVGACVCVLCALRVFFCNDMNDFMVHELFSGPHSHCVLIKVLYIFVFL